MSNELNNTVVSLIDNLNKGNLNTVQNLLEHESIKDNVTVKVSTNGYRDLSIRDISEFEIHELDEIRECGAMTYLNVETKVYKLPMIIVVEYTAHTKLVDGTNMVTNV